MPQDREGQSIHDILDDPCSDLSDEEAEWIISNEELEKQDPTPPAPSVEEAPTPNRRAHKRQRPQQQGWWNQKGQQRSRHWEGYDQPHSHHYWHHHSSPKRPQLVTTTTDLRFAVPATTLRPPLHAQSRDRGPAPEIEPLWYPPPRPWQRSSMWRRDKRLRHSHFSDQ